MLNPCRILFPLFWNVFGSFLNIFIAWKHFGNNSRHFIGIDYRIFRCWMAFVDLLLKTLAKRTARIVVLRRQRVLFSALAPVSPTLADRLLSSALIQVADVLWKHQCRPTSKIVVAYRF